MHKHNSPIILLCIVQYVHIHSMNIRTVSYSTVGIPYLAQPSSSIHMWSPHISRIINPIPSSLSSPHNITLHTSQHMRTTLTNPSQCCLTWEEGKCQLWVHSGQLLREGNVAVGVGPGEGTHQVRGITVGWDVVEPTAAQENQQQSTQDQYTLSLFQREGAYVLTDPARVNRLCTRSTIRGSSSLLSLPTYLCSTCRSCTALSLMWWSGSPVLYKTTWSTVTMSQG